MEVPRCVGAAASLPIVILLLAACGEPGAPPSCGYGDGARAVAGSFLTWNVYIGASVQPLFRADPTEWPALVEAGFQQVLQTNFAERATAIADRIAAVHPDLIGLQEVAEWLIQSPGDQSTTHPTPATETVANFLAILLSALEARGLAYHAVVVNTNADVELPSASGDDVRFKDRDVILARTGVITLHPRSGEFRARFSFNGITVARGWASIDAVIDGDTVRFTTTHLETEELERLLGLQRDQVNELLATWCDAHLPLVVAGDFKLRLAGHDDRGLWRPDEWGFLGRMDCRRSRHARVHLLPVGGLEQPDVCPESTRGSRVHSRGGQRHRCGAARSGSE
jgi:endonuclease/exonuclease/phosphatase family metal-dependent hydrolase